MSQLYQKLQNQQLMEPQRTDLKSLCWRVWHSCNYVFGGFSFLIGSILLLSYFATNYPSSALVSSLFYTFGSLGFALADFTEWCNYQRKVLCDKQYKWCQFPSLSFNFFLSLTGSVIYLIGSAMFIPVINQSNLGLILFIIGSSFIMVSQTWKLLRVIYDGYKHKNVCGEVKADANGFLVDLFAGLGGACYFAGSFLMFNPDTNVYNLGVYIFILGGFCFFLSGIFMLFRYFCCRKTVHDNEHTEMKSPMVSKWPHNY